MTSKVSCILTFHLKPTVVEAIESVLQQTYSNFELIIFDSEAWVNQPYSTYIHNAFIKFKQDDRVRIIPTLEQFIDTTNICMVSKCFNDAFRLNLVNGDYICTFYDDDIYYPNFFEMMATRLDENPNNPAIMCNQKRVGFNLDGTRFETPPLIPMDNLHGEVFDCRIDGGQVMFRRSLLEQLDFPYMNESMDHCAHSDGVFLDRLGSKTTSSTPFLWYNDILMENRKFPFSAFSPTVEKTNNFWHNYENGVWIDNYKN